jgi:hypothetical protein
MQLTVPISLRTTSRERALAMLDSMRHAEVLDEAARLIDEIARQLGRLPDERGMYRAVWIEGDVVIKVPVASGVGYKSLGGAACNVYEVDECAAGGYLTSRYSDNREPIAPCELVWHESGLPVVIMERIECDPERDDMPEWARRIDGHQVGWSQRASQWLIYDAGCQVATSDAPWHVLELDDLAA